jgi:hypothetical protein
MINKVGVTLIISKVGSLDTVASGRTIVDTRDSEKIASDKNEFLYFAAKAIAGDEPNGNGDFFPWSQLLKSHSTFVGRSMFLNHASSDPRNAIGKVLDAYPVVDPDSGEKYIECLCKIDAIANPELARQLSTAILDSVSMGCSVMTSTCSICGHTIHSDQDEKCIHLGRGLLRDYLAEIDLPDFNIKKGNRTQAYAINQGLNFTELSVVNVPAWSNAKIVQVISQLKDEIQKFASDKKEVPAHLTNELEDLLKMIPKKADLQAPVATPEAVAAPIIVPVEVKTEPKVEAAAENTLKKILSEKLSAFEYLDLVDFITTRAKKAEIKAEETPKMEAKAEKAEPDGYKEDKVKPDMAPKKKDESEAEKAEDKTPANKEKHHEAAAVPVVEVVAKAEVKVEADSKSADKEEAKDKKEDKAEAKAEAKEEAKEKAADKAEKEHDKKAEYRAIFVSKPSIKESYWVVTDKGLPVLKATLDKIWGDMLPTRATYAASWEYGNYLLSRLAADGVEKVASILDATVLTKEAAGAVGKDQYKLQAPHAPSHIKKLEEGKDMDGGGFPAAPGAGSGKEWPSQKSIGKDQYKPVGKGKKASEEGTLEVKAGPMEGLDGTDGMSHSHEESHEDKSGACMCAMKCSKMCPPTCECMSHKVEAAAPMAEAAPKMEAPMDMKPPMDMPKDMAPKKEHKAPEAPKEEHKAPKEEHKAPAEHKPEHKAPEDMSDEEKLEHIEKMLEAMTPADKLKKPMEAMCKALEKFQAAMEKQMEADAKVAEKEEAAAKKEEEKAEKEEEKAAKAEAKEEAKAEKAAPKEEAPKKEEKEASTDPKLDAEKKDVALAEHAKKDVTELAKHEKEEVKEMEKEPIQVHLTTLEPKVEVKAEKSDRELQLEAELSTLRAEKSMRAKAEFCKQVVSTMIDKRLVSADETDVQKLTTDGTPLFDARAQAFKLAADRQHALLLKMDSSSLKAFAESIERIAKPAGTNTTASYRLNNLPYSGGSESDWLKGICDSMGSQKGR